MTTHVRTTGPVPGPLGDALATLDTVLDEVAEVALWALTPAEQGTALVAITRLEARLAELRLRQAAAADASDVGADVGAASTGVWWAVETNQTRGAAIAQVKLGRRLETDRALTRAALAAGAIVEAQARVVVDAIDALPDDLDPTLITEAERHLLDLATHHDAKALRVLGKWILDVIAPEVGEEQERQELEAEERRAREQCRFTMSDDGHGTTHGRFTLPTAQAAMLKKQLMALAAPKHRAATGQPATDPAGQQLTGPHKLGLAFAEWIERRHAAEATTAPTKAGGLAATVVVTMTLAQLLGDSHAAAVLDTGERITAAQARRLACEAGIIPAVLGGAAQPLDIGRKARFHTEPQRTAIALRDRACTAQGCDAPPGLCHVHHDRPWATGGHTNVASGRLLCPHHHARAHDPTYTTTIHPDNSLTFHRRT